MAKPRKSCVTVHCAICLNIDNTIMEPAFTVIKTYAVCEKHVPTVSDPKFDIFAIKEGKNK